MCVCMCICEYLCVCACVCECIEMFVYGKKLRLGLTKGTAQPKKIQILRRFLKVLDCVKLHQIDILKEALFVSCFRLIF